MRSLLLPMPGSLEHNTPTVAVRMPNRVPASRARNLDPHHRAGSPTTLLARLWMPRSGSCPCRSARLLFVSVAHTPLHDSSGQIGDARDYGSHRSRIRRGRAGIGCERNQLNRTAVTATLFSRLAAVEGAGFKVGGRGWNRTIDPPRVKRVLYR